VISRRRVVPALGASVLAPFVSWAQQPRKVWRIGFLQAVKFENDMRFDAFKQRLRELGHVEGKTITTDYLSAEGNTTGCRR